MKTAISKYRPTRTASASGGGFIETLGTATTIYGNITYHDSQMTVRDVDNAEDILPMDVLVIQEYMDGSGAQYRVSQIQRETGQLTMEVLKCS